MSRADLNASAQRGAAPTRVIRVLVADDSRDTVLTLVTLLRDEGYGAKGVYNGRDAMVALLDFEPHVIISDIAMPELTGWDIARAVRKIHGERVDRPLLIQMSGIYNKGADRILSELLGFNHFLAKPFDPNAWRRLLPSVTPNPP